MSPRAWRATGRILAALACAYLALVLARVTVREADYAGMGWQRLVFALGLGVVAVVLAWSAQDA